MLDGARLEPDFFAAWSETVQQARAYLETAKPGAPTHYEAVTSDVGTRLPAISVDGPGFFVLRDGARELYSRAGRFHVTAAGQLLDDQGRRVMLTAGESKGQTPVAGNAPTSKRLADGMFDIDADGTLVSVSTGVGLQTGQQANRRHIQGRLCLAIFPAPQKLTVLRDGTLAAPPSAGKPLYSTAGAVNAGKIRRGPSEFDAHSVQQQLHQLWLLSGRAAIEVGLAATADAFNRIALNLVK